MTYFCYNVVVRNVFLSIFIYKIALENTNLGVLQKSSKHVQISIFVVTIFFPHARPPFKKNIKNEGLFLQSCSLKCVLPIFIIYNIALQNTDFGVLHKSSKHFIISIFLPPVEGDTPSLSHLRSVRRAWNNSDPFFLQFCS